MSDAYIALPVSSTDAELFFSRPFSTALHLNCCAPFWERGRAGSLSNTMCPGPRPTSIPSGIVILDPCSRLGTTDMAENGARGCAPLGDLSPHLTQCRLDQGIPLYQVEPWSIPPIGHNRHGPRIGADVLSFFLGAAGSPSNTMWLGPWPICMPSFILIQLFSHNTPMLQTRQIGQDRTDRITVR